MLHIPKQSAVALKMAVQEAYSMPAASSQLYDHVKQDDARGFVVCGGVKWDLRIERYLEAPSQYWGCCGVFPINL